MGGKGATKEEGGTAPSREGVAPRRLFASGAQTLDHRRRDLERILWKKERPWRRGPENPFKTAAPTRQALAPEETRGARGGAGRTRKESNATKSSRCEPGPAAPAESTEKKKGEKKGPVRSEKKRD